MKNSFFYLSCLAVMTFLQNSPEKDIKGSAREFKPNTNCELTVPYAVIEDVPVYPGCEDLKDDNQRKRCTSEKINMLANKNFSRINILRSKREYLRFRSSFIISF